MTKQLFSKVVFALLIFGVSFTACRKRDLSPQDADLNQSTADNTTADGHFEDVSGMGSDVVNSQGTITAREDGGDDVALQGRYGCGATVTISPVSNVTFNGTSMLLRTVSVDFGAGCTDQTNRRNRSGKMNMAIYIPANTRTEFRRFWNMTPGSVVVTTFDNFFVDGRKIEGTHTVTNTTVIAANVTDVTTVQPSHRIVVTDGKVTFPDASVATHTSDRTRTWTRGFGTLDIYDDEFQISASPNTTSSFSGINRRGRTYTVVITSPLVLKTACWRSQVFKPVQGTFTVTSNNKTATTDYGNGNCDNTVTITFNGKSYTIDPRSN